MRVARIQVTRIRVTLLLVLIAGLAAACRPAGEAAPAPGGSVENGRLLLRQFGCGSCHEIPGVAVAQGRLGPPLGGVADRIYLAGVLANSPQNMAAFIREPRRFKPRTVMPDQGITEAHARDMVAYLQTLR
jgi:cytochrome c2